MYIIIQLMTLIATILLFEDVFVFFENNARPLKYSLSKIGLQATVALSQMHGHVHSQGLLCILGFGFANVSGHDI